ncbi:NETI motif-containing protein [Halobacillus litoralis]|uniref:NETI motif-containing protein n=1 Tax=Halobacillus litoralis TaxID=45668 RepID=A0A845DYV8_9BACI|nr:MULTISPECIES: NETI motif-containing protein [Halobacillus]MYL21502.1 NETI motif-containing protein [Halobacillus litoralis]MYL30043.1 NETI motif-containing protein [Halobacillus halophilus]MYL37494.1 NETI motif-containing protein [Halobacillus litoralis]
MPKKNSRNSKMRFEVQENETIDDCLDRMKKQGYMPVRRMEEPIFREEIRNGEKVMEPVGKTIVFQAVKH